MANEILVTAALRLNRPDSTSFFERKFSNKQFDQTQNNFVHDMQSIGTTEETLNVTDLTAVGWAFFYNHDATNFVEIGDDIGATFEPTIRLDPGEFAVCRLSQNMTALSAKADTAAVDLEYFICDA